MDTEKHGHAAVIMRGSALSEFRAKLEVMLEYVPKYREAGASLLKVGEFHVELLPLPAEAPDDVKTDPSTEYNEFIPGWSKLREDADA